MTLRIGFVGGKALGDEVRLLLPAGRKLFVLTEREAVEQVGAGTLGVLIVALEGRCWRKALAQMMNLHSVGEDHPLAVFGLVPRSDPEALVAAFDLGVADCSGLPIEPFELRARLTALIRRREVALLRAASTRAAWRLAIIDPVTRLYNRHHLDSVLPAAIAASRAGDRPLALLMIDLDALKPYNDRWGHAAGDKVLRAVAEQLLANVRSGDTIARVGGDEIAVVMPDTDHETARQVAARLVETVAQTRIGRGSEGPSGVTVSIGLATLGPRDADAEMFLQRADAALYDAKRGGRNRVAEAA